MTNYKVLDKINKRDVYLLAVSHNGHFMPLEELTDLERDRLRRGMQRIHQGAMIGFEARIDLPTQEAQVLHAIAHIFDKKDIVLLDESQGMQRVFIALQQPQDASTDADKYVENISKRFRAMCQILFSIITRKETQDLAKELLDMMRNYVELERVDIIRLQGQTFGRFTELKEEVYQEYTRATQRLKAVTDIAEFLTHVSALEEREKYVQLALSE